MARSPGKKFWKITGITLGILFVLLVGFHFWFKAYAKGLIEDMVETNSHGKVKLQIGKFHFNYFSRNIQLDDAVFFSTDTATGNTAYRFNVEKIHLRAKAILPILFKKRMLIDSLNLLRPHIEVTRLRPIIKPDKKEKKDVSIPEEMGKIYSSIQDALQVLRVKKFQIDNGTFTLVNRIDPSQLPMKVSNLYFQIDNLEVDSSKTKGKEKILFSDNVIFRSHDQDILFPDGRHRLSFSNFNINLQKKLVHFDSCTIAATRKDSANASFNVFLDALDLTNIDFDTLYKSEVIKADSVYCINPKFNLEVTAVKKKDKNKPPPKLETIIQQLTGDLLLQYVIVTNADFNIKTIKDDHPSTFTFSKNNFEMQGLSIDQGAAKPIKVKSFAMAIRNYENFIKDSSYSIRFDSVILKDDRITLNNFIFQKLDNGKIRNTFSIPQFNLQGLSWDELVFERRLKAEQAIMFNPHISYTAPPSKPGQQNIFVSLGIINDYMDLQFLDIRDGMIDLRLKNNLRVQLDNANVAVESNSLLTSTKIAGIKNSLTNLSFKRGVVQAGDLLIELDGIRYAGGNGRFEAENMHVKSDKKNMNISLQGVTAEKLLVDEISGSVIANELNWRKANVFLNTTGWAKEANTDAFIELKNVSGDNTLLHTITGKTDISAKIDALTFDRLVKKTGAQLVLENLAMTGDALKMENNERRLSVAAYTINDNHPSSFRQLDYTSNTGNTGTIISIPLLTLTPHIGSLIDGKLLFDAVVAQKPVIRFSLAAKNNAGGIRTDQYPIDIKGLTLHQPVVNYTEAKDSGQFSLNWFGDRDQQNYLKAGELHISPGNYRLSDLQFDLSNMNWTGPKGRSFHTGEGRIDARIPSIGVTKNEDSKLEWDAKIASVDANDLWLDSSSRSKGQLFMKTGALENFSINSSHITNLRELTAANENLQVKKFTGQFSDSNKKLQWYNAGFDHRNNRFTMDSFSFDPVLSKEIFMNNQAFQKDYTSFRTGTIIAEAVDLDQYLKENTLHIGFLLANNFSLIDYKDRRLPLNTGIIKPLPVNLLKTIPLQLSIDTVRLTQANILYTERPEKAVAEAVVPVTRIDAILLNVKNYLAKNNDSLHVKASGYLLDTAWISLSLKESYTDPEGGFIMNARARPASLGFLNPILVPLANVRVRSGFLDTLEVNAIGKESFAWGKSTIFYHDLKIDILKNGEEQRRKFATSLANLLIKNNNGSRTGTVFFNRQQDRSAINYLVKIVVNAVGNRIGVMKNKKKLKEHKEEIDMSQLPASRE